MSLQDILGFDSALKRHPLWAVIGPPTEKPATTLPLKIATTTYKDKTATSLRLLLCEAQSSLEKFSAQLQGLAKDVGRATFQIEETLKLVEDRQETAVGDLKSLLARSQTTLMKSHDATKDKLHDLELAQLQQCSKLDNLQHQLMTLTQQIGKIFERETVLMMHQQEDLDRRAQLNSILEVFNAHLVSMTTHAARPERLPVTHYAEKSQTSCLAQSPVPRRSVQIQTDCCEESNPSQTSPKSISLKWEALHVSKDPKPTCHVPSTPLKAFSDLARDSTDPQDGISSLDVHVECSPIQQSRIGDAPRSRTPSPCVSTPPSPTSARVALSCNPLEESCMFHTPTPRKRPFSQVRQASVVIAATLSHSNVNHAYEEHSFPFHGSFGGTPDAQSQILEQAHSRSHHSACFVAGVFAGLPSDYDAAELPSKRRKGTGAVRRPVQRMIEQSGQASQDQETVMI